MDGCVYLLVGRETRRNKKRKKKKDRLERSSVEPFLHSSQAPRSRPRLSPLLGVDSAADEARACDLPPLSWGGSQSWEEDVIHKDTMENKPTAQDRGDEGCPQDAQSGFWGTGRDGCDGCDMLGRDVVDISRKSGRRDGLPSWPRWLCFTWPYLPLRRCPSYR